MKTSEKTAIVINIILIIAILILLFTSRCKKKEESQDCYICTVETTWFREGYYVKSVKEYPYCGVDTAWIKNFEKFNTYTDTTYKMVQTCKCKCK